MDATRIAIVLILWVAIGLATGLWMARRGHDPWWTAIAVVLGPLFVPIAMARVERQPRIADPGPAQAPVVEQGAQSGPRFLVGLDGSDDSLVALERALDVFGDDYGLIQLAEVVSFDEAEDDAEGPVRAARSRLEATAARLGRPRVSYEVLAGPPAETLRTFAVEQDMDVVVVGRRGQGLSDRLLGSVCSGLIRNSCIPVLVVDCTRPSAPRGILTAEEARSVEEAR